MRKHWSVSNRHYSDDAGELTSHTLTLQSDMGDIEATVEFKEWGDGRRFLVIEATDNITVEIKAREEVAA